MIQYIVLVDVPNYQKLWDSFASLEGALRYREKMIEVYWMENPKIFILKYGEEE